VTGHDLRLAPTALGCWLATIAALYTGVWPAVALGVLAAVAAACWARWGRAAGRWVVVGAFLGLVCGAAGTAARLTTRDAPQLSALVDDRVTAGVELTVREDPHAAQRGANGLGAQPTWVIAAQLDLVELPGPAPVIRGGRSAAPAVLRIDASVLVLASHDGWRGLLPGQRVSATVRFGPASGGDLRAAVLSAPNGPTLLGPPPWPQRAAGDLRAGLQRACEPLDDAAGGLLPGLVVGDTSALDPAVRERFQAAGMTHLTAVSGSNVAFVVGAVLFGVRRLRAGPRLTATLCALAVVAFVILARPSPSVLRAAAMGGVALLALATGRGRVAVAALCATIVALLLVDPELATDAGFALSVLATAGLLLLAPGIRDALRARGAPSGVAEALAVPTAAQLACAPVVAAISGSVSLVAIPANLLAAPAIAPATYAGVVAAAVSPVWPAGAEFAAWLGSWPARWLVAVAETAGAVPAGLLPWPAGLPGALLLAGLTLLLLVGFRRRAIRRVVLALTLAVVLGALPVRLIAPGWPPPGWLAVLCDVGQGDALVINVGDGGAIVVDAGPDPGRIDGCLRRLDVRRAPLVVISHFHVDHIGGLPGVLRDRTVDTILTTSWPEPAAGREAVRRAAAAAGTTVRDAPTHGGWTVGAAQVEIIPSDPVHGSRSDPNNNSLLLAITVRGIRLLLLGDAETEQQRALLDRRAPVRADVLKVAHHGSAFQDPSFLDQVRAGVALVGVGADNDYGHPNASVLARLAAHGTRVLRTDVDGDIAVTLDAGRLAVVVRGAG
jgi:competence protein ComEC